MLQLTGELGEIERENVPDGVQVDVEVAMRNPVARA
jgi:hypothetical protein